MKFRRPTLVSAPLLAFEATGPSEGTTGAVPSIVTCGGVRVRGGGGRRRGVDEVRGGGGKVRGEVVVWRGKSGVTWSP